MTVEDRAISSASSVRSARHEWVYYVDVATRAIYDRRCKVCGLRESLGLGPRSTSSASCEGAEPVDSDSRY